MKKLFILLFALPVIMFSMAIYGAAKPVQDNAATQDSDVEEDSTINIMGWFNKTDTLTYRINQSTWNIHGRDTVQSDLISAKVRINVVDSTAKGYKMNYTFLDFSIDTTFTKDSPSFDDKVIEIFGKKMNGTTVQFETDEYGAITKLNNLGKFTQQTRSYYKDAVTEALNLPEFKALNKPGFESDYMKKVDIDKLADDYLAELRMLFMFHGLAMAVGDVTEHQDAIDTEYETTKIISVSRDNENGTYHIVYDVKNTLPREVLKDVVIGIEELLPDDKQTSVSGNQAVPQSSSDGTYEDCFKIDYMLCGWPYYAVRQKSMAVGPNKQIKQTVISLDSYSLPKEYFK